MPYVAEAGGCFSLGGIFGYCMEIYWFGAGVTVVLEVDVILFFTVVFGFTVDEVSRYDSLSSLLMGSDVPYKIRDHSLSIAWPSNIVFNDIQAAWNN